MGDQMSEPDSGKSPPHAEASPSPHAPRRDGSSIVIPLMLGLGLCAVLLCAGIVGFGALSYTTMQRDMQAFVDERTSPALNESNSHTQTFSRYYNAGDYPSAFSEIQRELALNPESAEGRNNRAWMLATCPDPEFRDGEEALEHAQIICQATNHRKSEFLDTLAAAHAERGEFDAAVKWQSEAIRLAPSTTNRDDFRKRLELYQSQRPFRHAAQ